MTPDRLIDRGFYCPDSRAPYEPVPAVAQMSIVEVDGYQAYLYIPEDVMHDYLWAAFDRLGDTSGQVFVVNNNGGKFMYNQYEIYCRENNIPFPDESDKVEICYKRGEGDGVDKVTPLPDSLKGKKVVLFEDVYDRGRTIEEFSNDCKSLGIDRTVVVAAFKQGVPGQVCVDGVVCAVVIANKWVGGSGMNIGDNITPPKETDDKIRAMAVILVKKSEVEGPVNA